MTRAVLGMIGTVAALLLAAALPAGAATGHDAAQHIAVGAVTEDAVPISGADRPSTAAPLLTPGRYVDTFSRGGIGEFGAMGTTKYYVVAARPGVHPYISVTLSPPDADPDDGQLFGVEVALLDSTVDVCAAAAADDVPVQGRHQPVVAVLNGPVFGDPAANASCPTDELAILQVNRTGEAFADVPLEAEIVVRMEPPADTAGLPGPAPAGADLPAPAHTAPTDLAGGRSFAQAPTVFSGATYRDTIATGDSRYYRIPLSWGQRFAYSINEVGPADPALGPDGVEITADVFNPVREHDGFASTASMWFGTRPGATMSADTDYPVRYTNRDGVLQAPYALDGDYVLRLSAHRSAPASSTGFVLTVTIHGDPQTGPSYLPVGSSGTSGTSGTSGSSGGPPTPAGSAGVPTARADPLLAGGVPAWGWWVIAAAGAVVCGVLVVLGWSRRRPDQTARHR